MIHLFPFALAPFISLGLSAHTDDNTGKPLGDGYITLSTSAGNALLFSDPASANSYLLNNPGQFNKATATGSSTPDGDYSQGLQNPAQS